jgi:hypothetical protein
MLDQTCPAKFELEMRLATRQIARELHQTHTPARWLDVEPAAVLGDHSLDVSLPETAATGLSGTG